MGEWKEDGYGKMFVSPATVLSYSFSVGFVYMFAVAKL